MCGTISMLSTKGYSMKPESCIVKKYEILHSRFCCDVNKIVFTISYIIRFAKISVVNSSIYITRIY